MRIALTRKVKCPTRGTGKSAGLDFYIPEDFGECIVSPQSSILIPSGVKAEIPENYMLQANEKSGVCTNTGLIVGAKVVDEDYQGEIHMHVINTSNLPVTLKPGTKLVQFVLVPVLYVQPEVVCECELFKSESERGTGGFGSTGE